MSTSNTKEYIICSCGHIDHMFVLMKDKSDDNYVDLALTVHLCPVPFFQRIKKAFSYIFGKRSRYGDFDEVIINRENALKIQDFLSQVINDEHFK